MNAQTMYDFRLCLSRYNETLSCMFAFFRNLVRNKFYVPIQLICLSMVAPRSLIKLTLFSSILPKSRVSNLGGILSLSYCFRKKYLLRFTFIYGKFVCSESFIYLI